ncbi:MAG: FKBP-type peptidyl-prolyl cis-trans isomerase [Hymenobacteraceae bacterium]|nr:FKBP-type peptidyl-prolyl cis-trans isomerase [Hymenobacteraceae bacterium]
MCLYLRPFAVLASLLIVGLASGCEKKKAIVLSPAQIDAVKATDEATITAYVAAQHLTATRTASGVYYAVETPAPADAPAPTAGQQVTVSYKGVLLAGATDGLEFDSSNGLERAFKFTVGASPRQTIEGWDEGIRLMHQGEHGRLIIPSHLAYGSRGYDPVIPANAVLIFYLGLESIQ